MKDYTLNKVDKYDFILNYEIKENKMIINYASGLKYETDYTTNLEKNILLKMKEQIELTNIENLEQLFLYKTVNLSVVTILIIIGVALLSELSFIPNYTLPIGFSINLINIITFSIENIKKLKDYKKNKKFIKNMEMFQNGISKEMALYMNLPKKERNTIDKIIEKKKIQKDNNQTIYTEDKYSILREPTINTIDKISPKTFNGIYDLLVKNEEFSEYYDEDYYDGSKKIQHKKKTLLKNGKNYK